MISFVNTQGSVKIRLACSKALLLTISSSSTVTHTNGHIKGDISFFMEVGAANVLLKGIPENKDPGPLRTPDPSGTKTLEDPGPLRNQGPRGPRTHSHE